MTNEQVADVCRAARARPRVWCCARRGGRGGGQTAPAPAIAAETKTTWYFYTVKWGSQDEFLDLFQKNHYPAAQGAAAGRPVRVRAHVGAAVSRRRPRRLDLRGGARLARGRRAGGPTEQELIAKMYPDQATFRKEERRRFELLVAHWDVPLNRPDRNP